MRIRRLVLVLGVILLSLDSISGARPFETLPVPPPSRRLIVELIAPSVAATHRTVVAQPGVRRRLDVRGAAEQAQLARIRAEQDKLLREIAKLEGIKPARVLGERGSQREARFGILLNAIAVDVEAGQALESAAARLRALPGVRAVHADRARTSDLYASLELVDAPALWSHPAIGTRSNAGAGIKLASVDGGLHHDSPMFSGTGFSYPPGYPLGDTSNTNGKIIASRAYFRAADPPAPGDENPWPGVNGTSHGVHTGSIAAGNQVTANYVGHTPSISGVAPAAWVMSYRVFYPSVSGQGSFYDVEGIAALEDVVADGADVVNNSWGAGPGSTGGVLDPLDQALLNASAAGVFVTMSMGNSGPGIGTGDHPSSDYISVAATTSAAALRIGRVSVTAPTPVPPELIARDMQPADFGSPFPNATVTNYDLVVPATGSEEACAAFPAGTFTGKLVLILRGTCEFGVKVLNVQNAGAVAAIVYNHTAGGDALTVMGPGAVGAGVTIPSGFIGNTAGVAIRDWWLTHGALSKLDVDTIAYEVPAVADVVADFSSRGPGVGGVLKPDIAAPGVSILAQGYAPGASGEDRHFGYGMASGTSMAAPHVAGAAALLRQIHPGWSNDWIKSALMSTARHLDVFNANGSPAQPLDFGAGRLDLSSAADPGVILEPPSLTFPPTPIGSTSSRTFRVISVAGAVETWTITSLYTGAGFAATTPLAGVSINPPSVTLAPGGSALVTVSWDSATSLGFGDNQGYVELTGSLGHQAHLPVWMRVVPVNRDEVLIIDNDGSSSLSHADYAPAYTTALYNLGIPFAITDVDASAGSSTVYLPDPGVLAGNRVVIYETGDNYQPNGTFTVPVPPTQFDSGRLIDYVNSGGRVLAFGQDLSTVFRVDSIVLNTILGAFPLQDSVSGGVVNASPQLLSGVAGSPFAGMSVDMSSLGDGADNLLYVDELVPTSAMTEPVFYYVPADHNIDSGYVALFHHDEPTLERRGRTFLGRAIFFAFGLEGLNNDTGSATREELMERAMNVVSDTASVDLAVTLPGFSFEPVQFDAVMSSTHGGPGVTYRWDFGDGSAYATTTTGHVEHTYATPGTYLAAVEAINAFGTHAIGERTVVVPAVAQTAPIMIGATATGTSTATVTWHAVPATQSEIWRSSGGAPFALRATVSGSTFNDSGLATGTTYLYKVRAMSGGTASPFSAVDPATTVIFTDPVLTGVPIKAVHVTQLRAAVNAIRAAAGLGAYAFSDPVVSNALSVRAAHLLELRMALDGARAAIGLVPVPYTHSLTPGTTVVRAIDFQEVRGGTQ